MDTTNIQTELQTRLEIIINAHTTYSDKFKFEFRPFMINANAQAKNNYGYMNGDKRGIKTRMVFLPITHLVDEIFPMFKKRYKKQGMTTFTNSEEYLQYVKFSNGVIYQENEEEGEKNGNFKSKYIDDDYIKMINRNIKFILTELFNKNRILINVFDNNNNNNNINVTTRNDNRLNQEYFIETFAMPVKESDSSPAIFKDSVDEIQKLTNDKTTIDRDIAKLEIDMKLTKSTPSSYGKLEFQIRQKKIRREKIIQQIFTYTYGELDIALKEDLRRAEQYRSDDMNHYNRSYNPEQELKRINARLKLRKVRIYIVTIGEMSLVPSLLDNGKDNPQFTALRNKLTEGDFFDGRVKSESIFQLPTRAQCASDKRIIERMYDEIFNAKRVLGKSEKDEKRTYVPSNYLEDFKKLFDGIGANNSSEYFDKTTFNHLTPTYEGMRTVAGGDEDQIVILCRTKMGAFLLFFTLLESETLKLHRPNISSMDKVHIRQLPMKTGTGAKKSEAVTKINTGGGGDTFEVALPVNIGVKNLDLILNMSVPPSYFTSNADYEAYNEYKTRDSVYKRFDFFALGAMNNDSMESRNYAAAVKVIGVIIKDIAIMRDALINIDLTSPKPITEFFTKIQELVRALSALSKVSTDKGKTAIIKVMLTRAKTIEKMISSANDAAIEFFNATELSQNKKSSAIAEYDNARMAFITKHNTRIRDTAIADAEKICDNAMIDAIKKYETAKTNATRKKAANDAAYGIATDKADKAYETAINRATTTFNSTNDNTVYTAAKTAAERAYNLAINTAKDAAAKTTATADFKTEMAAATKAKATAIDDATTVYTNAKTTAEETYIKESEKASAINAKDDKLVKDNEFTIVIDDIKKQHTAAKVAADKAVDNYKYKHPSANKDNATKNKNRADAIVKEDEAATKTLVKLAEAANVDYSKPVKLFRIGPMQTSMDEKLAKKLGSVQTTFKTIFYFNDVGIQGYNAAKQNSERLKNAQVELIAAEKAKADINLEFFTQQFILDKAHYDEAVNEYTTVTGAFMDKHKDKNRTAFLAYEDALKIANDGYTAAAAAAAKKPAKDTPFHVKTIIDEAVTTPPTPPTKVEYSIPAVETAYTIAKDSAFETFATAVKAKGPINEIKPDLAAIADAKKIRDEKKAINEISKRALEVPFIEDANAQVQVKIDDLTRRILDITNDISTTQMQMSADELQTKYAFKLIETDFKKIIENPGTASAAPATTATSKKPESKFDDLEFLKGIIDHVEESVDEDEAENDENAADKVKMAHDTRSKIPVPVPVKPVKIEKVTSVEIGEKIAHEMKAKGAIIITDNKRGLQNHGNTCYMNAALQLIFSMTKVKDQIIATKTGGSDKSTFHYLKQYMEKMNGGADNQPANELFDSIQGSRLFNNPFGRQEDSQEMLTHLLDGVEPVIKTINDSIGSSNISLQVVTNGYTGAIDKCREKFLISAEKKNAYAELKNDKVLYFKQDITKEKIQSIEMVDSTTSKNFSEIYTNFLSEKIISGRESNIKEEILKPFKINECKSIFEVVEMTDDEKKLEPNNTHKFKYVKRQNKLQLYPIQNYLIIHLKRFSSISGVQKRISTSIDITNSEIPANDGTPDVFRILGCICHHGSSTDSGHYTYVSFEKGVPTTVYDDGHIYKYSDYSEGRAVDTDCYVLLFERVTKAKTGGARETKRCQLNLNSNNRKYTRRHNKNKDRVVTTVTVIKR
jgi:ubiquitin C-terminal hydrolase